MEDHYIIHGPSGAYVAVSYHTDFKQELLEALPNDYYLTETPGREGRFISTEVLTGYKPHEQLNKVFKITFPDFVKTLNFPEQILELTANPELLERVPDTDEIFRGSLGKLRKVAEDLHEQYDLEIDDLMAQISVAQASKDCYENILAKLEVVGKYYEKALQQM